MKKIIAVANQKGGVGKTTSIINLASSLALSRKRVLVVDIDPQGNATTGSGIDKNQLEQSVYNALIEDTEIREVIIKSSANGYDILPSNRNLAGAEIELVDIKQREFKLKNALTKIANLYDIILIDCPPSLSLLTLNGLIAADYLLVPIQCEYYALEGLTDLLNTVGRIKSGLNDNLELLGLIRTMYDKRNNLANQVSEQLALHFKDKLFKTYIPRNVRLAEAPSHGVSAVLLERDAIGAKAYLALAKEITKQLNMLK